MPSPPMPKLKEVLEKENAPRETPINKRTVRLVRMGAFLRAYDWSAWLLKRYGSPLNAGLDTGDGDAHVFVGFPVASIEKFTPEAFFRYDRFDEGLTKFIPEVERSRPGRGHPNRNNPFGKGFALDPEIHYQAGNIRKKPHGTVSIRLL